MSSMRFAPLIFLLASAYALAQNANSLGPLPPPQTLYTLGAAVFVALIAATSRAFRESKTVPPWHQLLGQMGMGFIGGLILPLFVSEIKPISFGTAIVLGSIGGAFGWQVVKGIAKVLGGTYKISIDEDKPPDKPASPNNDAVPPGAS